MRVGIVGAGKLGSALARRSLAAGHQVLLATRPGALHSELVAEVMAPGAQVTPIEQWGTVDLAILAVPYHIALGLELPLPRGTVVIDPTNYWEPVDGPPPNSLGYGSTSETLAARHPGLRWVKSLNQLGYHDLDDLTDLSRVQMRYATDDDQAAKVVAAYLRNLSLDPINVGPLSAGNLLEPGHELFDAGRSAPRG